MTATSTQPMTCDEFYEKFPWVFSLPERPQCRVCQDVSWYEVLDGWVCLREQHKDDCTQTNGLTKLYPLSEDVLL